MRLWAAVLVAAVVLMSAGNAGAAISKYIDSYGTTNYEEYDRINIFVNNASLLPCWVNYTCEGDCYQAQPNWPSNSYCNHRTYVFDVYMGGAWNVQHYGGTVLTPHTSVCGYGSSWSTYSDSVVFRSTSDFLQGFPYTADCTQCAGYHTKFHVTVTPYETECSLSGTIGCIGNVSLYWDHDGDDNYNIVEEQYYDPNTYASYSFDNITCGAKYAAQYDYGGTYIFVASGHMTNSYSVCPGGGHPSIYPWDDIWIIEGYDYNVILLNDGSDNPVIGAQVAIYDTDANNYIQKWTSNSAGQVVLGAQFAGGHDVQLIARTFDGVFTFDTSSPAYGHNSNITFINWTIPLHYNLRVHPEDQFGTPLTEVFCGLSEYTPLNPLSFWGCSTGGSQYVPVTNCSGFAMCDLYAEKGGYADYNVTALNWTSRSAMVKDYRHDVTLQKE